MADTNGSGKLPALNGNGRKPVKGKGRGKGGGRPEVPIDMDQVEKLASINCSRGEIAEILGISKSTIDRRCEAAIKKGQALMKMSLKRGQFSMAMGQAAVFDAHGNVLRAEVRPDKGMLIWLGKVVLQQVEAAKLEITGEIDVRHEDVRSELQSRMAGIAERVDPEGVFRFPDGRGRGSA